MRRARLSALLWIAGVVLGVTLPARGDNALLTQPVLFELTAIDSPPSVPSLNSAFTSPEAAQTNLGIIALDTSVETGIRIRALRTLPAYCPAQGCGEGAIHQALSLVIAGYVKLHDAGPVFEPSAGDLMLMRAAVEAMGAAHAVMPADIPTLIGLLSHPSRDIRATVVHALRTTCDDAALDALRALHATEPTAQVRTELTAAEQELANCVR